MRHAFARSQLPLAVLFFDLLRAAARLELLFELLKVADEPAHAVGRSVGHLPMVPKSSNMVGVQIFGVKNSQATRAAERFFKERRAVIQFVDLKQKPMARGEVKRFADRFGLTGLVDTEGKAYVDAGMKYLKLSDSQLLERIERDPNLLRLPLVRSAGQLSVGRDEDSWKAMLSESR
jgi:arsenate reductase